MQGRARGLQAGYEQDMEAGRLKEYDEDLVDAEKLHLQGKGILSDSLFSKEDTSGAGNLLMDGIATAYGDTVYFSLRTIIWYQPPDSPVKKFCDHPGKMLQVYEGFLYHIGPDGIYRAPLDGSGCERIVECGAEKLWVDGGRLCYANRRDKLRLYTAALDGRGHERCGDIIPSSYETIRDRRLYYCPRAGQAADERKGTAQALPFQTHCYSFNGPGPFSGRGSLPGLRPHLLFPRLRVMA